MESAMAQVGAINALSNIFKTGNPLLDVIILSMIPIIISSVIAKLSNISKLVDYLFGKLKKVTEYPSNVKIVFETIQSDRGYTVAHNSSNYEEDLIGGVMIYCKPYIPNVAYARLRLKKSANTSGKKTPFEQREQVETILFPEIDFTISFENSPIKINYSETMKDGGGEKGSYYKTVSLELSANSYETIEKFTKTCYSSYIRNVYYHEDPDPPKHGYISLHSSTKGITFKQIDYKISKSFDTLFFPEKEEVLRRLKNINNPEYYKSRSLSWRETFFLKGPPGTGKTSFIKSLVQHTDRTLIYINLNDFSSNADLLNTFYSDYISLNFGGSERVPQNDRIYVIEDIDAMENEAVKMRKSEKSSESEKPEEKALITLLTKQSSNITLSCLLNCLDGIFESAGSIFVITTNHPENLDDALVRDGRITCTIEFSYMLRPEIRQMFEFRYARTFSDEDFVSVPDAAYAPAKIESFINQHPDDPFDVIKVLSDISNIQENSKYVVEKPKIFRISQNDNESYDGYYSDDGEDV